MTYSEFLRSKVITAKDSGFDIEDEVLPICSNKKTMKAKEKKTKKNSLNTRRWPISP